MDKQRILLVEDDPAVAASVRRRLAFEGFEVETAADGQTALEAMSRSPSLLILDVMLPGMDGFQLAEKVRQESDVPILMLTARDSLEDRVTGLERGADDYLVKPFELPELLARIRALLRRARIAPTEALTPTALTFEDLELDSRTREVRRAGELLQLTPREFSLLEYFLRHPRQVLTREQILEEVWGYDHEGSSNVVDVFVRQLRDKTEFDKRARLLQTVRGVGYVLRLD